MSGVRTDTLQFLHLQAVAAMHTGIVPVMRTQLRRIRIVLSRLGDAMPDTQRQQLHATCQFLRWRMQELLAPAAQRAAMVQEHRRQSAEALAHRTGVSSTAKHLAEAAAAFLHKAWVQPCATTLLTQAQALEADYPGVASVLQRACGWTEDQGQTPPSLQDTAKVLAAQAGIVVNLQHTMAQVYEEHYL